MLAFIETAALHAPPSRLIWSSYPAIALDGSVAAGQLTIVAAEVALSARLVLTFTELGACAVGRSLTTATWATTHALRPWFVPVTVSSYVPAGAAGGAVTVSSADLADQPNTLLRSRRAVQPSGMPETDRRTRSKNVELRLIVIGTDAGPPTSGTLPGLGLLSEN